MTTTPARTVTACAPAKVNLHLSVGPVRPDGFHDLVTVYHALDLVDRVTLHPRERGEGLLVSTTGEQADVVPDGPGNLAARAVMLLAERIDRPDAADPDVAVAIEKRIPVAAGLAGGSADAAAALVAAYRLWQGDVLRAGLAPADLAPLAAELGSDVPFALAGGTALGTGRGEVLHPVLARGRYHWVLAFSSARLPTPAVYRELDLRRADGRAPAPVGVPDPVLAALGAGDPVRLGAALANDLQAPAVGLALRLGDLLRVGGERGALGALVSGSGPTAAFLVADEVAAETLAEELAGTGLCRCVRIATGPAPGARLCP